MNNTSFKRTLVTSALPYANGDIHLGHIAGAYLDADIYVRYRRLRGDRVLFICGSDEHGVPITLRALQEGVSAKNVIDRYHTANDAAFKMLSIQFDIYGRTSWPEHIETTQDFFKALDKGGHIVKREIELWYSPGLKRFLPDRYVKGVCPKCGYRDANGDECENCGAQYSPRDLLEPRANIPGDSSKPELRPSGHWFLKLGDFKDALKAMLDRHPEWRANTRGIANGWISDLKERCITRDTDWGVSIPVDDPDADGKRIYVWFDAPIGYVTNTKRWAKEIAGDPAAWELWWKAPSTRLVHFIGKDNVPFHAVIFPAMLAGQDGYILPDNVPSNDYLNVFNRATGVAEKGSKSKGNMISVRWFAERFSADAIRYYLCSIMPETSDSAFDWDGFRDRYNGELCNIVGNFIHRSLTMTHKNFDGIVPDAGTLDADDQAMLAALPTGLAAVGKALDDFRFRAALDAFVEIARQANRYFDAKQPWVTRKTDMARTATTLHVCCRVIKALCGAMAAFLPNGADKLAGILGLEIPQCGPDGGPVDFFSVALEPYPAGAILKEPVVIFPKIPDEEIDKWADAHQQGMKG